MKSAASVVPAAMRKMTLSLSLLALLSAGTASARIVAGAPLPDAVNIDGETAQLNGAAIQKVSFFKIYAIALYLGEPTRSAEHAISSEQPKQLRLRALRSLPRDKVEQALREGFERTGEHQDPGVQPGVESLMHALRDVRKDEEITFTYRPGEGTEVAARGRRTEIPGKGFAKALFSIWLGSGTDAPKIRSGLLGG
jgi:hypothetical protein